MHSQKENARDPVAAVVEEQLRDFAQIEGTKLLYEADGNGGTEVCFDSISARGENLDIAILRLANALLEDDRYSAGLTRALGRAGGLSFDGNLHDSDRAGSAFPRVLDSTSYV